jgi:hypothetical protein
MDPVLFARPWCSAVAPLVLAAGILAVLHDEVVKSVQAADAPVSSTSVDYVSGGLGVEERARIAGLAGYNLQVMTAGPHGEYLAGARVQVTDAFGARLLDTTLDGPWLLVRLPPGRYRISAEFEGERRVESVEIPAVGRRQVVLRWNGR